MEEVLSATELGEYCLLYWTKVLRMGPAGGLHVAAMLVVSLEGGAACAHAEDDLGRGETTSRQEMCCSSSSCARVMVPLTAMESHPGPGEDGFGLVG